MIPEIKAIQDRLALGLITEREAKELCFLIELVSRDYLLSAPELHGVDPETTGSKAETKTLDGNCP
ncbi:MAG TPA: hypothetical protein P5260_02970 [Candidatus Competibacter sp.]|nr:hypothetical protein [Candidatus Competibacter sp.]